MGAGGSDVGVARGGLLAGCSNLGVRVPSSTHLSFNVKLALRVRVLGGCCRSVVLPLRCSQERKEIMATSRWNERGMREECERR